VALQNRVTPFGDIVATPARGAWMGNRGVLHGSDRTLSRRRWTTRAWITCRLEFKDRHRRVMTPGRYTELFFLDEATALAAGHRPCGECRRHDFDRFRAVVRVSGLPGRVVAMERRRLWRAVPLDRNGPRAHAATGRRRDRGRLPAPDRRLGRPGARCARLIESRAARG